MALQEGIVDISKKDNKIWMVKIPNFVFDEWEKAPTDAVLGTVTSDGTKLNFVTAPTVDNTPAKEFVLNQNHVKNFYVFRTEELPQQSTDEEKKQYNVSVAGTITTSCNMTPKATTAYASIVKSRVIKANAPTKETKKLKDSQAETKRFRPILGTKQAATQSKRSEAQKDKATRMDKEELEDLLFKLFREQHYWKLRELAERTNQPLNFLKQQLEQLCTYNSKGEHKGEWELKDEYKLEDTSKKEGDAMEAEPDQEDWM